MMVINREIAVIATGIAATLVLAHCLRRKRPPRRSLLVVAFTVYLGAVVAVTLFPIITNDPSIGVEGSFGMPYSFVPFEGVMMMTAYSAGLDISWILWENIAGNVIMFVPLGLMLPLVFPKLRRFGAVAGIVLGATVSIELSQLLLGLVTGYPLGFSYRVVDTTDVILNFAGGLIGYGLYRIDALGAAVFTRRKHPTGHK